MKNLTKSILTDKQINGLLCAVESGACPAVLSGVGFIHMAHAASALYLETGRPVVMICSDENEAKKLCGDMSAFTREEACLLTGRDYTFYNAEGVSRQAEQKRLGTLYGMLSGGAKIMVATVDGLIQRTMPPEYLEGAAIRLKMGCEYDLEGVTACLVKAGYDRCDQVEGPGQFALRGGILDFFSPFAENPVRCEFFGDDIDSMGFFDVESQRRIEAIGEALILPSCEAAAAMCGGGEEGLANKLIAVSDKLARKKETKPELLDNIAYDIDRLQHRRSFPASDRYMELIYPRATAADYVPADALVILCEPKRVAERAKNFTWQLNEDIKTLLENGVLSGNLCFFAEDWEKIVAKLSDFALIMMDNFSAGRYPVNPRSMFNLFGKQLPSYGGSMETACGDVAHYMKQEFSVLVLCQEKRRGEILKEFFESNGVAASLDFELEHMPERGVCSISVGALSAGVEYPESHIAVITEGQIMAPLFRKRVKKRKVSSRQRLESFSDLSPGDLIVHENYGIGRFVGIVQRKVDNIDKDYIKIAYAGTDVLYVPATQLDMVSKYIGSGEDRPVRLSKMGGTDWARTKLKTKGAVKELAKGLIQLQAQRRKEIGFAFSPDTKWQEEFEEAFQYRETDDQLRSIKEIKEDMESPVPMDRLLCGDVGYGKTEVAMRAVMKCVMDGKQAAILAPTTVLAQQHYATAMRRFSGYPVRIEVLSRFRSAVQMREAIRNIGSGTADIIIGTHRLLQKDLVFRDLGLLIVDEEQRFGVAHKERLKEIAKNVDVLTLSATPIPRTLNMALSGIRDMSTIEEPPSDRQPVQTYVLEHDWSIICDAINREVSRGGQVYYLHNRVENIDRTAARLAGMLGDVSVAVAHGKMDEEGLSDVMQQMATGEVQVLVCTTIIETGIDIPNVNTLIIEDADKLGLAQLHQIRGRVGRSSRRAYAYFTFRQGKALTEVANKRLSAIREFAEFNSGFKIAMRDLEIRGAGNILGAEQSGHMMSVGFDMYLKLLEEAVTEEKGEKTAKRTECSADLSVSANIPESYVPSGEQRMDLYRRIAHIRYEEDADDIIDEMIDRYGDPPKSVNTLVYIAILRGEAENAGISEIVQRNGTVRFTLTDFDMEIVSALYEMKEYKGAFKIEAGAVPVISLRVKPGQDVTKIALKLVRAYAGLKDAKNEGQK